MQIFRIFDPWGKHVSSGSSSTDRLSSDLYLRHLSYSGDWKHFNSRDLRLPPHSIYISTSGCRHRSALPFHSRFHSPGRIPLSLEAGDSSEQTGGRTARDRDRLEGFLTLFTSPTPSHQIAISFSLMRSLHPSIPPSLHPCIPPSLHFFLSVPLNLSFTFNPFLYPLTLVPAHRLTRFHSSPSCPVHPPFFSTYLTLSLTLPLLSLRLFLLRSSSRSHSPVTSPTRTASPSNCSKGHVVEQDHVCVCVCVCWLI